MSMKFTLSVAALCLAATPALAQTDAAQPRPTENSAPEQMLGIDNGMSGADAEAMRTMMREMIRTEFRGEGRRGERERRGAGPRHHERAGKGPDKAPDRGPGKGPGKKDDRGGMHRGDGMHAGMMRAVAPRLMFAIVDADGDGALSIQEVNDFHARIFNAIDENNDGNVELSEIQAFFGPAGRNADD